jgi:Zn finger protein HypA/HybF involved in hydrogenase expression
MHEAGIAAAIAAAIRERDVDPAVVRVVITGAHHEPAVFDPAVRLHLSMIAPELDADAIPFVHRPAERPCLGCGMPFVAVGPDVPCPACGGPGLPSPDPERVELEWDDDPPESPSVRDRWPSQGEPTGPRLEP